MKPADRRWYRDGRYQHEVDVANDGAKAANDRLWGREPEQCPSMPYPGGPRCERPAGHRGFHASGRFGWGEPIATSVDVEELLRLLGSSVRARA